MTVNSLFAFFDEKQPCPQDIDNCKELRKEYFTDIANIKDSSCAECQVVGVRDKFIKKILNK